MRADLSEASGGDRRRRSPRWPLALGSRPAAATRSAAAATKAKRTTAKPGPADGRADDLQLAAATSTRARTHRRRVRRGDRGQRQLHRGHQRQRRLLRQDAAAAGTGRVGRPQHLRRHRLDGETDVRPRLPAGHRPRRPADRRSRTCCRASSSPRVRPGPQVLDPVAERHDRDLGRQRPRRPRSTRSTTSSTRSTRARSTMLDEVRETVPLVMKCRRRRPGRGDRTTTG